MPRPKLPGMQGDQPLNTPDIDKWKAAPHSLHGAPKRGQTLKQSFLSLKLAGVLGFHAKKRRGGKQAKRPNSTLWATRQLSKADLGVSRLELKVVLDIGVLGRQWQFSALAPKGGFKQGSKAAHATN